MGQLDTAFTIPDNTLVAQLFCNNHDSLLPMASEVKHMFINAFPGPIDKRWKWEFPIQPSSKVDFDAFVFIDSSGNLNDWEEMLYSLNKLEKSVLILSEETMVDADGDSGMVIKTARGCWFSMSGMDEGTRP
jgi:hypothetical protein